MIKNVMFSLVGYIVISLCLALLAVIICASLLIWVMKSFYPRCISTINLGLILGGGSLIVVLFAQSFLFFCACYAKKCLNATEKSFSVIVNVEKEDGQIVNEDLKTIKDKFVKEYPVLERYMADMSDSGLETNIVNLVPYIRSVINNYQWRRGGWALGCLIAFFCMLSVREAKYNRLARISSDDYNDFNF